MSTVKDTMRDVNAAWKVWRDHPLRFAVFTVLGVLYLVIAASFGAVRGFMFFVLGVGLIVWAALYAWEALGRRAGQDMVGRTAEVDTPGRADPLRRIPLPVGQPVLQVLREPRLPVPRRGIRPALHHRQ
jgi:hypothetical protein